MAADDDRPALRAYEPPLNDDAPLDDIEQALVRALVRSITRKILEEDAAARENRQRREGKSGLRTSAQIITKRQQKALRAARKVAL